MRFSLFIILITIAAQHISAQEFLILNLRNEVFSTTEVCQSGEECFGMFNIELVNDSSMELLSNSEYVFSRMDRQKWIDRVEGKSVLFVVHGMAKGWSEANKDLCNVYWSLQKYASDMYDVVIGVSWPGDSYLGISPYFRANRQSLKSAKLLGPIAKEISKKAHTTDIMTHSMGSKVMCKTIKKDKVHFDHAYLLAPSIMRNSLKPLKRWRSALKRIDQRLMIFYSNGDYAFNWTAMQHLGMGYRGMKHGNGQRYDKLTQVNCNEVVNQGTYRQIRRSAFSSRSNHSYYTQCPQVFEYIKSDYIHGATQQEVELRIK